MKTTRSLLATGAVMALAAGALVLPATADAHTSDVHVVHGIPGVTVDVCVDGAKALTDFAPNTRTDALPLEPATYAIEVVAAGDDCDADAGVIGPANIEVPAAGLDLDLVAHLDTSGTPTLSAFVNDVSTTAADNARLAVRHTANFGAVDVLAGGAAIVSGLENPDGAALEVPGGAYDVAVTAAGDPGTIAAEVPAFALTAGVQTIVYAVGTPGDDFALYPFTVDVGERSLTRLAGDDRFETAAVIALEAFPEGAETVYLARADEFADALAARSLPTAPLLLVPTCGDLPAATADALAELDPDEVVVLGGTAAVCPAIAQAAAAYAG